jgi:hypothetical protein
MCLTHYCYPILAGYKMVFKGQDAWRTHPLFRGLWKSPFPGFRNAAIIYGFYLGAEFVVKEIKGPGPKSSH